MTTFDEARNARIQAARELAAYRSLQDDMLAEWKAFDDAVESKAIRYVRTPKGADLYDQPIGSPIRPGAGKPKLDYTRKGPKRRGGGSSSSPSAPGAGNDESTKKVNDLTPGERGREKSRLQAATRNGGSDADRARLRDIERREADLDASVRNTARPATPEPAERPRIAPAAPRQETPRVTPTQTTPPPARGNAEDLSGERIGNLTDRGLKREEARLAKTKKRTPAQNTRLLQIRLQINRRAAAAANDQARRVSRFKLPGQKSADLFDSRFDVDEKAASFVGVDEWDCDDMDAEDLTYFLAKSLSGRPTVEKLSMANSILTEMAARVEVDEPEGKELTWEPDEEKVRHVRTPEGARLYDRPIGSPIRGRGGIPKPKSSSPGGTSDRESTPHQYPTGAGEGMKPGQVSPKFVLDGDKIADVRTVDGDVLKGNYYVLFKGEDGGDTEDLKPTRRLSLVNENGVVFTERVYRDQPLNYRGRQLDELDAIAEAAKKRGKGGYRDANSDDYKPFRD